MLQDGPLQLCCSGPMSVFTEVQLRLWRPCMNDASFHAPNGNPVAGKTCWPRGIITDISELGRTATATAAAASCNAGPRPWLHQRSP
jgi:hypothetical protein